MADGELTNKQQAFIDAYLTCWNASEAARRAGYSADTAYSIGSENLRKPEIAEAIKARLAEKAMAADEVLARLGDQARSSMADFLSIGPRGAVKIDLKKAKEAGQLHLLHRYSKGKNGIAFELYDAQAALVQIAKLLGMYPAEKMDVNIHDVDAAIELELARVADRRQAENAGAPAVGDGDTAL